MKRNWSKEEIEILRNKKAEGLGYSEIQKYLPNRSVDAINLKSSKLGISKDAGEPWTDKEIEILKERAKEPIFNKDLVAFLPKRTEGGIEHRLTVLNIDRSKEIDRARIQKTLEQRLKKLREVASNFGLNLDLENFKDNDSLIKYRCPEGHTGKRKYRYFHHTNYGCPQCGQRAKNKNSRLKKEDIIAKAEELRLELNLEVYKDNHTKINARCLVCDNRFITAGYRVMQGQKCKTCAMKEVGEKNALSQTELRSKLSNIGLEWVSGEYKNTYSKIKVKYVKCGHENIAPWNDLRGGRGCSVCLELSKPKKQDYVRVAKENFGEILKIPKNKSTKATWKCRYGHTFKRRLFDIQKLNSFCTTCSQNWGEGVCRTILEKVFDAPFPKVRLKEMKSSKGKPLEYDCYNDDLKIALEHNGMHHYKSQENWGGEKALSLQKKHDLIRSEYAQNNKISLLIIPEIGSITPLEEVPRLIAKQLKASRRHVPKKLLTLDIRSLEIKTSRDFYIEKIHHAEAKLGFKILDPIARADDLIKMKCKNGHIVEKTPRSLVEGKKCHRCYIEKRSKPVKLSDGRTFKSRKEAGDALGVNKTTVNRAVLHKKKVKGVFVYDI